MEGRGVGGLALKKSLCSYIFLLRKHHRIHVIYSTFAHLWIYRPNLFPEHELELILMRWDSKSEQYIFINGLVQIKDVLL